MGYGNGIPLVLLCGGVVMAIRHLWILAALLIAMAVFGFWLLSSYYH